MSYFEKCTNNSGIIRLLSTVDDALQQGRPNSVYVIESDCK